VHVCGWRQAAEYENIFQQNSCTAPTLSLTWLSQLSSLCDWAAEDDYIKPIATKQSFASELHQSSQTE